MRVKGKTEDGFLLCFLINLLFNFWWGAIAFILLILHIVLRIPLFWSLIGLFIWLGVAFVSTLLVMVIWAAGNLSEDTPNRKNLNPYSTKNSDVFPPVDSEEPIDPEEPVQVADEEENTVDDISDTETSDN